MRSLMSYTDFFTYIKGLSSIKCCIGVIL